MKITTNNKWREIVHQPHEEVENEEIDTGFYYKKEWYSLSDFMITDNPNGWHGIHHYTYDSGLIIKLSDRCDSVIVGRF